MAASKASHDLVSLALAILKVREVSEAVGLTVCVCVRGCLGNGGRFFFAARAPYGLYDVQGLGLGLVKGEGADVGGGGG